GAGVVSFAICCGSSIGRSAGVGFAGKGVAGAFSNLVTAVGTFAVIAISSGRACVFFGSMGGGGAGGAGSAFSAIFSAGGGGCGGEGGSCFTTGGAGASGGVTASGGVASAGG